MSKIKIRQIRSIIDRPERQKLTIKALGLGRPNWEKIHNDTPQIRGMINKVSHLVVVEEFKEEKPKRKRASKKKAETEGAAPAESQEK
jgi:large subunit ribosomal protein L30